MSTRSQRLIKRAPSSGPAVLSHEQDSPLQPKARPLRRRAKSKDMDTPLALVPEEHRTTSLMLLAACFILFLLDLFYLMGYIEGVDSSSTSTEALRPAVDGSLALRGASWNESHHQRAV